MASYGGLKKEDVLKIYKFVIKNRRETKFGQRKLHFLIKERFDVEIKEGTISNWIFHGLVPFNQETTQFKVKQKPDKKELYDLYLIQGYSSQSLGLKYRVSTVTVINWLKFYKIPIRTHIESMNTYRLKESLREHKLVRPTKDYSLLNPDKAYILGVLCGDGHINPIFIGFEIRHDHDFIKEFIRCFNTVYGLKYDYKRYKPRNTLLVRINNQIICKDLSRYGKFGTKEWNVPNEILKSKDEKIIGSFLRGFFDSEGSVSRSTIVCSSINKTGLDEIAELLSILGIKSTIKPIRNGKYYTLYIFRKERFKIFRDKVGFSIKRKINKVNDILNTGFFCKRSVA